MTSKVSGVSEWDQMHHGDREYLLTIDSEHDVANKLHSSTTIMVIQNVDGINEISNSMSTNESTTADSTCV